MNKEQSKSIQKWIKTYVNGCGESFRFNSKPLYADVFRKIQNWFIENSGYQGEINFDTFDILDNYLKSKNIKLITEVEQYSQKTTYRLQVNGKDICEPYVIEYEFNKGKL